MKLLNKIKSINSERFPVGIMGMALVLAWGLTIGHFGGVGESVFQWVALVVLAGHWVGAYLGFLTLVFLSTFLNKVNTRR